MITMLMYSHVSKELKLFRNMGFEISCRLSEEDWDFPSYHDICAVSDFLSQSPILDLALVDVTQEGAIPLAESMRRLNAELYMILLTDVNVSPVTYIKPSILAASLLMRPVTVQNVKSIFTDAIRQIVRLHSDSGMEDKAFIIESKEGKRFIPYGQILFFESRDKKIFVNTKSEEYFLYGTLDEIEQRLGGSFLRCHRSFIVAKSKIKKVMISQGVVMLDGDFQIPLSRSYRKVFKELK